MPNTALGHCKQAATCLGFLGVASRRAGHHRLLQPDGVNDIPLCNHHLCDLTGTEHFQPKPFRHG